MRIKLFHQQLISHFGLILIAILTFGIAVPQFVENVAFKYKEEELIEFGHNILNDMDGSFLSRNYTLDNYADILAARNIYFGVFDANGQFYYPPEDRNIRIQFTNEEWNKIIRGEQVVVHVDSKRFQQAASFAVLPYSRGNYFLGGILLISPITGVHEMINNFNDYLVFTVAIAIVISFLLSWISSKIHVRRINQLKQATSSVAEGEYHVTVPNSGFDEIGELAEDFNIMLKKLAESKEEIESLENRRRQFIADVSHEMRTPLTTIQGVIEGLQNDMIPESEKEKGLELVSKEAKRLIRLVNENLDYEKIRSNQITLEKEMVELEEVFEVIEEQLQAQAKDKNNDLCFEADKSAVVYADYDRLIQILLNIAKNSIQFTENGKVMIRGSQTEEQTKIEIEDTGIGMDAAEIEQIWRRFYKADISRRSNAFGEFGLGLSIVKKLVELHNGKISVTSSPGKGTKFTILLPLK